MSASMHRIINVETNEITDVEFTAQELEAYAAVEFADQEKADAKATAKAALLERLGITADEAALLLG
jgi:ribosome assembly protein YihI (activator of Der GTPase)